MAGMRVFALTYHGKLMTETMLVPGINTSPAHLRACAQFIAELQPEMAYLALPLRAPAESWVEAPDQQAAGKAYEIFVREFARTSLMADLPPTGLTSTQDALQELVSTLKVHPMEEGEIRAYLRQNELADNTLESLLALKRIRSIPYREKTFYSAAVNQD
jgi:wyosine [tRNA(Phe)-imidazoG37] synthetase (radical SAM superfamily)